MQKKCIRCNKEIVNNNYHVSINGQPINLCKKCFDIVNNDHYELENFFQKISGNTPFGFPPFPNSFRGNEETNDLIDLTEEVKNKKDPIIHREKELDRIIRVLSRKTKSNPILIGEPGVGKTAIVELLARKIANNELPRLSGYKVLQLNISGLMSETKFRGDFEKKFEMMMDKIDEKTILFIDEMHLVMGAGANQTSEIDFSNLLKPYLTNGRLKLIGATTLDEYRRIEKDAAFNRRLQPVVIKPFSKEQTLDILKHIKGLYEMHHKVYVKEELLTRIVDLSDEFIHNRNFPDKAIDLLDEACAKASIQHGTPAIEFNEQEFDKQKEKTIEFFLSYGINLKEEIENIANKITQKYPKVTDEDLKTIVQEMSGIPVNVIEKEKTSKLRNLKESLQKEIIGQNEAIEELTRAVKRSLVRLKKKKKPTVLFFAGPTGVGKTESAKILAKTLFGDRDAMIRLDMSEFMEEHSVSKLIGTPPGYVGFEEEGQLSEKVRRNPFSIVLLDEFEKAHPKISRLFLQIFDDGRLTDSKGRVIDFKNTIIIMTSNVGASSPKSLGFGVDEQKEEQERTIRELKAIYPPEFLNRIDEIIVFNSLTKDDLRTIAKNIVKNYKEEIKELGYTLTFENEDEAIDLLVEKAYNPTMGARPLSRVITKELEDLLVENVINAETRKLRNFEVKVSPEEASLVI